jgi:uridine kinase
MFVIGITGGTASGKTSLVNELKDQFKEKEPKNRSFDF